MLTLIFVLISVALASSLPLNEQGETDLAKQEIQRRFPEEAGPVYNQVVKPEAQMMSPVDNETQRQINWELMHQRNKFNRILQLKQLLQSKFPRRLANLTNSNSIHAKLFNKQQHSSRKVVLEPSTAHHIKSTAKCKYMDDTFS